VCAPVIQFVAQVIEQRLELQFATVAIVAKKRFKKSAIVVFDFKICDFQN